ncbi:MAG TPA: PASTA domain-containing protein, partial [Solirubrobacteraceae bacterium]|nr:PASTA domain-containing protein [Solirubrobacteraceae bacterium]
AASQPAGGAWSAAEDLSAEDAYPPQLAVDRAGDAVVVWARTAGIVRAAERPAGGAWGAPRDLSLAGQEASNPDVAMGPTGSAVAVWERFDGSNYIVQARRQRVFGGSWGTRFDLSAPGRIEGEFPVQVALGESGDALAVWVRFDDTGRQIIQAAREPGATTWDPAQDLSAPGQNAHYPQVAVDPAGNAVAAWTRSDGSHDIVQAAGLDAVGPTLSGLSIPTHGTAGKRLSFSLASAFDVWSALAGPPHWFFGDGASAVGNRVTHVFGEGYYTVTVSQGDVAGNQTSSRAGVTIAPAPCVVPKVVGLTLARARAAIKKRHCRSGRVARAFSKKVRRGRVLAQHPRAGKHLAPGARVT